MTDALRLLNLADCSSCDMLSYNDGALNIIRTDQLLVLTEYILAIYRQSVTEMALYMNSWGHVLTHAQHPQIAKGEKYIEFSDRMALEAFCSYIGSHCKYHKPTVSEDYCLCEEDDSAATSCTYPFAGTYETLLEIQRSTGVNSNIVNMIEVFDPHAMSGSSVSGQGGPTEVRFEFTRSMSSPRTSQFPLYVVEFSADNVWALSRHYGQTHSDRYWNCKNPYLGPYLVFWQPEGWWIMGSLLIMIVFCWRWRTQLYYTFGYTYCCRPCSQLKLKIFTSTSRRQQSV